MPDSPPKNSLLDRLRRQSDALRDEQGSTRRPQEDAIKEIDRRLWRAFKWIDEALSHLEVIRPHVAHDFAIPGVVTIASPRYDRGFVSYRRKPLGGQDVIDHVELFYRLDGGVPIEIRVQASAAASTEERLRGAHLQFDYQTEQDASRAVRFGRFSVTPAVTASVRFEPDYRRQVVDVTLRNVDRFESVCLEFGGEAIDEVVLEDLLRFILGEANTFLRRAPLAGLGRRPVLAVAK
jgi:hypothetical protein